MAFRIPAGQALRGEAAAVHCMRLRFDKNAAGKAGFRYAEARGEI